MSVRIVLSPDIRDQPINLAELGFVNGAKRSKLDFILLLLLLLRVLSFEQFQAPSSCQGCLPAVEEEEETEYEEETF